MGETKPVNRGAIKELPAGTRERIIELRAQGLSQTDIARITKVDRSTVSRTLQRAAHQALATLNVTTPVTRAELQSRIERAAPSAFEKIVKHSEESLDDSISLRASQDIMDRAGFKPVERTLNVHAIDAMTADELVESFDQMLERIKSKGEKQNEPVEIKPEVEIAPGSEETSVGDEAKPSSGDQPAVGKPKSKRRNVAPARPKTSRKGKNAGRHDKGRRGRISKPRR